MTKVININEPVVWETYDNIKILDIHPDQFDFVKNYIMINITSTHLLYRNEKQVRGSIPDTVIADVLKFIGLILQDRTSLIAIDENTNEIIGAIVLKIMDSDFHAWTSMLKIPQTRKLRAILNVTHFMLSNYNDTKEKDEKCLYSLHCLFVFTSPEYCGLKLKTKLLLAAGRVAASMKIPYLTYVAFSVNNQRRALRAGMIEEDRIYYALYKDQDGNRPFDIKLKREWFAILYMKPIVPQVSYTKL